ncbi:MAG TPA: excinuclease ABC subunit UvrA [Acidobacteriaceae bacterium]|jgi:excinuclease ABC subunit A|nr:excinuclease ABC subunit UvrA [Acidobacteriaceae bacterium]
MPTIPIDPLTTNMVRVRGAREHNLKNVDVDIPRDALVVFSGVSGSGKSSLAFGTLYAEAQRRYLESVSPYARRLFHQLTVPEVDSIDGLPPAVALQQQRGSPTTRSSVGSVTTLSNLIRMLYSRAGDYPRNAPMLYAENFSSNRPEGACPRCHGLGRIYEVTEQTMVPDPSLTIRQRAIAAWPTAWQGQNQRDILVTLGYDVDRPWRDLPKKDRNWILFTEDQPTVPVYAGFTPAETRRALRQKTEPSYMGTFTSARRYVMETFSKTQSAMMKRRVSAYMLSTECPVCHGKRLRADALEVKFAGVDIAALGALPLKQVRARLVSYASEKTSPLRATPEKSAVALRITQDIVARLDALLLLGLGYLAMERSTPTLSPGELQRLRLATQMHSNLFGVVYVLDEPSAGLHPSDTETLLHALDALKRAGNSLFVIEHEVDVIRRADWIVDVGPGAGEKGGEILYSGPPAGLRQVPTSKTRLYLDARRRPQRTPRTPRGWLRMKGATRNNLHDLDAEFPLGVFTSVTGVSGSGKSTLVSQVLVELVADHLGQKLADEDADEDPLAGEAPVTTGGSIVAGMESLRRLVQVDQKPIGRTPRSNMATYTGLFDHVRRLFAATKMARDRRYDAGRFSFNVAKGRCPTCSGEGFVCVELLFLPSVYSPCPACHGARFNPKTLEVKYREKTIADVLSLTVDAALEFFSNDASESALQRALSVLSEVGLGYLRLGQPATELSGGEAQRIKLATELQRPQKGDTLYVLDEPTTGLHPSDVERLLAQLNRLVESGNTVITVEHDMDIIAASDWVIDIGPGAGEEGGRVVAAGTPREVAQSQTSRTAPYIRSLAA